MCSSDLPYKNSRKLQGLIWDKLVAYVNDFNLSNQEKSRLILRLFDDVKLLFDEVPVRDRRASCRERV